MLNTLKLGKSLKESKPTIFSFQKVSGLKKFIYITLKKNVVCSVSINNVRSPFKLNYS